ncbi:MAG: protein kinase [Candidatus Brocadiia bacterium]
MATLKCPYCDNEFDLTDFKGERRVECPMCGRSLRVVRRKGKAGTKAEVQPQSTTAWGTEGFRSSTRRDRYGEIKKGDVLGGFRIEHILGAGAMAVVYEATQLSLDRRVALKILPKEFAERDSFVRQFDSETELLASLNHPNIVNIIDRGREGDTYYFAMEFVEGTTLGDLLSSGQMNEEFFIQIMEQCAEALIYAHSKGIIHRDLKPANIMLNDQGIVKIADFGVAGLLAEAQEEGKGKKKVMGTRGYMPPEQEIHVNRTDERSDIFSLGAVMYRVLTGKVPDRLPPKPPSKLDPEVDPRIDSLVLKCLEAAPKKRYQSAEELLEALQSYHRQISRAQEVCPECQAENPVSQKTCLNCGADLSSLFDVCPVCGAENRVDVEVCMECGRSLKQLRQQESVRISKIEERARALAVRHRYEEAINELKQVFEVKGKVFKRARDKARRLIANFREQREEYFQEKVKEARSLATEAKLGEAMKVLKELPKQLASSKQVRSLVSHIQSQMNLAKKRVEGVSKMLADKRYEEAEKALESVEKVWVNCPGLEDARRRLEGSRQTEEMVGYELGEAKEQLEAGNFAQARAALQFAMSTTPDSPEVKKLLAEIERRERKATLRNALQGGKKAFEEGHYRDAARCWQTALELLPEGDERRAKLEKNVRLAKQQALGTEVVPLELARVVRLEPTGVFSGAAAIGNLLGVLLFFVMSIFLIGAMFVYVLA